MLLLVPALLVPLLLARAGEPSLRIEGTAVPGGEVLLIGESFPPNDDFPLTWDGVHGVLPTARAHGNGGFRLALTVPVAAEPGAHTVAATSAQDAATVVASVVVDVRQDVESAIVQPDQPTEEAVPASVDEATDSAQASPDPTVTPAPQRQPGPQAGRAKPSRKAKPSASPTPTAAQATPAPTPPPPTPPPPTPTAAPVATPAPAPAVPSGSAVYVAPTGNDAGSGTSSEPWRTLQRAADLAPAGTTVYVRGGTYAGATITRPGVNLTAYPGETPVVNGGVTFKGTVGGGISGFVIQGNTVPWGAGVRVENSSGVAIVGNVVRANVLGVYLLNALGTLVQANEITDNAMGVEVHQATDGTVIRDNRVVENDRFLDASRSAGGVNFYYTRGGLTLTANTITGNNEVAIEIYAASDLVISENVLTGSNDLIETGTEGGVPCSNLTIVRNIGYHSGGSTQRGFYFRCASNSLVAHNTLDGMDAFAFGLNHGAGAFAGSIEGLRVVNNVVVNGRAYGIDTWPMPASVVVDYNLAWNPGSGAQWGQYLAYVANVGNTSDLATFQSWTGYEAHGISADPLFVDRAARNYGLSAGSPAVDRALALGGLNGAFTGAAPDLGRYER